MQVVGWAAIHLHTFRSRIRLAGCESGEAFRFEAGGGLGLGFRAGVRVWGLCVSRLSMFVNRRHVHQSLQEAFPRIYQHVSAEVPGIRVYG